MIHETFDLSRHEAMFTLCLSCCPREHMIFLGTLINTETRYDCEISFRLGRVMSNLVRHNQRVMIEANPVLERYACRL